MILDEKLRWFGFWLLDALKGKKVRTYYDQIRRDQPEQGDSPVDGHTSHDGDNSVLLFACVHVEHGLECTPHNPYFLFGAKLVYGSCKGRM